MNSKYLLSEDKLCCNIIIYIIDMYIFPATLFETLLFLYDSVIVYFLLPTLPKFCLIILNLLLLTECKLHALIITFKKDTIKTCIILFLLHRSC